MNRILYTQLFGFSKTLASTTTPSVALENCPWCTDPTHSGPIDGLPFEHAGGGGGGEEDASWPHKWWPKQTFLEGLEPRRPYEGTGNPEKALLFGKCYRGDFISLYYEWLVQCPFGAALLLRMFFTGFTNGMADF